MAGSELTISPLETKEDDKVQKAKDANQARFEEDLEFVQSLANPHFVQELTLNGTLRSEPMVNYLNYLKYFHHPNYSRFIRYPNALRILDLLNGSEKFQTMIEAQENAQLMTDKFIQNWISLSGRLNKLSGGPPTNGQGIMNGRDERVPEGANGMVAMVSNEGGSLNGNSP